MIKTIARFEHKVGDRIYNFTCDSDAPLGEVHDALIKFKSHVVSLIVAAEPKVEPKEEPPINVSEK